MKTSAELQRISYIRKLTYFGMILVLFTIMTFYRSACELVRNSTRSRNGESTWLSRNAEALANFSVSRQSRRLQLNESDQGQADLAGTTARLSLSGARGFVICFLWIEAIENQKKHEWNEVELLTNTITKLQPHFLTPWLFQSWNLAYNVSVEADRVRDKYFYIGKGISLLCDGERINRYRGIDANGEEYTVGNPDMRFWIAFYYSNKFGSSDEQQTLRSLFQMSCINPAKRDPSLLRPDGHTVDLAQFEEFVAQNPMLCRRLRDYLRCQRPEDVVDFLADNSKIPIRHELVDDKWVLKRRSAEQWPVFPDDFAPTHDSAPPHMEVGGEFESYRTSWAWHVFAQQPLPPVAPGKPAASVPPYDHLRYRMARAPASIIFRQQPARGLSYIAERFMKEGWFDDSGWVVDEGRLTDHWFEKPVKVGNDSRYSAQEIWRKAREAWDVHGRLNGFLLSESEKRNLASEAELFRTTYEKKDYELGPDLSENEVSPEMWRSYDAQRQLIYLQQNLTMTNFRHHYYRAEAEKDDRTVKARKLLFAASRSRANPEKAVRLYEEGFRELVGDPETGRQGLLEAYPDFRRDSTMQEEWLEKEYRYLIVLEQLRSPTVRSIMLIPNVLAQALVHPAGAYSALVYTYSPRHQELPTLFRGPLDGQDSKDEPWVEPAAVALVKSRLGLIRRTPTQPPTGVEGSERQGPK